MNCPSCNANVRPGDAYCDHCGVNLPQFAWASAQGAAPGGIKCPGCGTENLPGSLYCDNCGMLLPTVDTSKLVGAAGPGQGGGEDPAVIGNGAISGAAAPANGAVPLAAGVTGRFVVNGSNYSFDFPSGKPELLIGRAEPDSRYFPDIDTVPAGGEAAGVSRRHAKLTTTGGRVYIEDLGSTNFTFVNRQRLQAGQRVPLNPGDEVRLGRLVMLYYP